MLSVTQYQEMIMPPSPPVDQIMSYTRQPGNNTTPEAPILGAEETFIPGEFDYIHKWDRPYVRDAYQVITNNEWWGPFRSALLSRGVNDYLGFQFTDDPLYTKIMNAIVKTRIGSGHSGCSIGSTMRSMQIIAIHGEAEYRRQCIKYQEENDRDKQVLRKRKEIEEIIKQIEEEDRWMNQDSTAVEY